MHVNDMLVSSYFSTLGAVCGCALFRSIKEISTGALLVIFMLDVFFMTLMAPILVVRLFSDAPILSNRTWNTDSLLATSSLSFAFVFFYYSGWRREIGRHEDKLTYEEWSSPLGRRAFGIALIGLAVFFFFNMAKLVPVLRDAALEVNGIHQLLLVCGVLFIAAAGAIMCTDNRWSERL